MPSLLHLLPRITPYLLAIASVSLVAFVNHLLLPYLGTRAPMLLFTLPIVVCALFCGPRSAVLATILSILVGTYLFIGDAGSFYVGEIADQIRLALFALVAAAIVTISALREKTEASLQDSEQRFRLLVQSAHDVAVIFISPDGVIESWNEGAERINGYREAEVIGRHFSMFYPPDADPGPEQLLQEALDKGFARAEGWRLHKDGAQFWADVAFTAVRDVNGRLRGFSKITHDRTREHTLLKSLEESEQTAKALLESTAQAVVGINPNGRIRLVNRTAERMFGYAREELIGQPIETLLPEKSREQHVRQRASYFEHAKPRPMGQGMDLAARRKDGTIFPIEVSINTCDTPAGRMAVSFVTDISKRKQIEKDLLVERSQLKSILDYSPLLVSIKDLSGRIILANQSFAEQLGVSPESLVGKGVFDLLPPDMAKQVWQRDQDAMKSRAPLREEEQIRLKDGISRIYATIRFPVSYINSLEPFGLCTFALDITEQKEAEQRALHAAQHDPLTDLPNRALIYEFGNHLLANAKRTGSKVAILFFDLDRFKPINDTYGHEIGDKMLQEVARRISCGVRSSDLVGRLGGDEFIAFLTNVDTDQSVHHSAEHLLNCLREPYKVEGLELRTSPSIGISLYPDDGAGVDELIRHADAAMYHAKANGRNTYQFFNLEIDTGTRRVFALEQRLRHSFHESEFELYYQPIVRTADLQIYGVEALIRWKQKGAEPVMPGEFILAAEACGLINQLGAWVLQEACRQQMRWQSEGLPPLRVAVNVSPIQFRAPDFGEKVAEALRVSGITPTYVELEVTESTLMREVEATTEILVALKELGIRISLDDFGTGYSSLSHLSRLPIDKLKVDQSFVQNMESDQRSLVITETVIGMAKKLGVEVVAEGIESEDALDLLRERDCDLGQGYYFSAPVPAAQFTDWLRNTHTSGLYH